MAVWHGTKRCINGAKLPKANRIAGQPCPFCGNTIGAQVGAASTAPSTPRYGPKRLAAMGLGLGCGGIVLLFAFIMLGVFSLGSIPTDGPVNTIALILVGGGVVIGGLGVLFLLGAGLWAILWAIRRGVRGPKDTPTRTVLKTEGDDVATARSTRGSGRLILRPRNTYRVAIDGNSVGSLSRGDHSYDLATGDHLIEVSGIRDVQYVTVSGGTTVLEFGHFGTSEFPGPFEFRTYHNR